MAQTVVCVILGDDGARLAAIVGDRNRPLKHVHRARIVLLSAERLPVLEIAPRVGVSRPAVWRWQQPTARRASTDKTRPPGRKPLPPATVAKVLALTCSEPPGEVTHWTGRAVAAAIGISLRAVQRIWAAHRLQPHRIRTFKRSNDPAFSAKVEDIVGLYINPPVHAVVLSIDEKSQIQALDREKVSRIGDEPSLNTTSNCCATLATAANSTAGSPCRQCTAENSTLLARSSRPGFVRRESRLEQRSACSMPPA